MKKVIFIGVVLMVQLQCAIAQNQPFVGRILYKNTFISPTGVDITPQIATIMGTELDFYISGKNYKSMINSKMMSLNLYKGNTNHYYVVFPNNTGQKIDASIFADTVLSVTHLDTDTLILGRKCKAIFVKTKEDSNIYFYDPTLFVNKADYTNHKYGNWYRYLQETNGALPIKYVFKTKYFTWYAEPIKIETMKLSDKDFELSPDLKIK
jgi:hypothetical protein